MGPKDGFQLVKQGLALLDACLHPAVFLLKAQLVGLLFPLSLRGLLPGLVDPLPRLFPFA